MPESIEATTLPTWRRAWTGRVFQSTLFTIATSAAMYSRATVSPLQEALRTSLALSDNQMALLQGPALAIPIAMLGIPIGHSIDRHSRVRWVLILASLNLAGSVLTAMADTFSVLVVARSLVGLTSSAIFFAVSSLFSDLYPPAQRGRALMALNIFELGGIALAFSLGGTLLENLGAGPDVWRETMWYLTCPLILVMALLLAMREPQRTGVTVDKPTSWEAFVGLWRYRAVIAPLVAGLVMVTMADSAAAVWAAPTFARNFGLAPARIGTIMAIAVLGGGATGSVGGGILADICQRNGGPRRVLVALGALLLLSVPAGLFAVMPQVSSASILLVSLMLVGAMIAVAISTLSIVVIPNELRGLNMAVMWAAALLLGQGLSPVMVSLLSGAIGGAGMIGKALAVVCVITSLFGAAVFIVGSRHFAAPALQLVHAERRR